MRTLIAASLVCLVSAVPSLAMEAMAGQSMMMKPGETMMMMPNGMTATMPASDQPMDPAMMQSAKPMENCMIMMMGADGKMYMSEDMKLADGKMACESMAASATMMSSDTMAMQGEMPITAGGDAMMVPSDTASLMVDTVDAQADGWIVVHAMADGKPGEVIGYAAVKKGMNNGIAVALSRPTSKGEKLSLMLHADTGKMGVYEFGMAGSKEDAPAMMDGKPVMEMVTAQ